MTERIKDLKDLVFDPGPDPGLDDLLEPQVKRRGKSTGRTPIARQVLSERPITTGWTVCWEGTEGSCRAVTKRLLDGTYRPDLTTIIDVIHAAHDVSAGKYLVLWRRRST